MNKLIYTLPALILLSSVTLYAQEERRPDVTSDAAALEAKVHAAKMHQVSAAGAGYDIRYQRCIWSVDPAIADIAGNITTYFMTTAVLSQMTFVIINQ